MSVVTKPRAAKGQLTGMCGVFLVAANLSRLGFIVSTTSRSAIGADLLVTDQACKNVFSVQVKTNAKRTGNWLVGKHAATLVSKSHVYVLVNLVDNDHAEYFVVPSRWIAKSLIAKQRGKSQTTWYWVRRDALLHFQDGWKAFGNPN